ncbi:MAG: SpoVR family protein, partial [Halobaculum sp.]
MIDDRTIARREAETLEEPVAKARDLAERLGLEPYPVNYWIVDYDEMNELIAYDGFQTRYPHWRWGMKYDRQQKQDQMGMGKAFEIVNNDNPCHAFLQESNTLADQKAVITHVEAHADFFRNNQWFGRFAGDDENPDAAAMLERHAETIESYASDPEIDRDEVERFVDAILTLEDTIDQHRAIAADREDGPDTDELPDMSDRLDRLDISEEVRSQVFDEDWLDAQDEDGLAKPRPDVLGFLLERGKEYDEEDGKAVERPDWKDEILALLRRESYYFAPQKMTKVMNEGWACVTPDTLVFTTEGLVPMREVVENHHSVSDGEAVRDVYDSNVIEDHDTVTITTRRGFEITGSNNHRVRLPDGSWKRLDELDTGDTVEISGGNGTWPEERVSVEWSNPSVKTLDDVAEEAGVSVWTVMRYRDTGRARAAEAIETALDGYDEDSNAGVNARDDIRVPETVGPKFGRLLGLLVGDGHVSTASGQVGFTNESEARAEEVAGLFSELFGIEPTVREDGSRWRVQSYREGLIDLLTDGIGLPSGKAAARKSIPECIRRSPEPVVAEFLRGLFDADGYAGEQGVILSSKSEELSRQVLLTLTNFGIVGRLRKQSDGCHHVHLTGESAATFDEKIGFGYDDKQASLRTYLDELSWLESDDWTDEIVEIEHGTEDVYDISVEETHRYAAAGVVNHNSKWESLMMADEGFAGTDEFLTYADHMARVLGSPGLNPYKLGFEIWQYVENRANRREVIDKLLRVEGVTWRTLHDLIDFEEVQSLLSPD